MGNRLQLLNHQFFTIKSNLYHSQVIGTASNYPTHLKHGQFRSVSTRTFVQRRPTLKYLEGIHIIAFYSLHNKPIRAGGCRDFVRSVNPISIRGTPPSRIFGSSYDPLGCKAIKKLDNNTSSCDFYCLGIYYIVHMICFCQVAAFIV